MSQFYVVCNLGVENGRVMLGHLHNGQLQVSEVRRFPSAPVMEDNSVEWDIPRLYHEILEALRIVASYEEPVQSISCSSAAGDYLLFDREGALVTPAVHHSDPQAQTVRKKLSTELPWDIIYEETGTDETEPSMFLQLGAEPAKRLKHASHVLPIADGFNFLLSGESKIETSMASATQLFNPVTRQWSDRLVAELKIRSNLLPPIVNPGTVLGNVREAICKETGLEETRVVASCSEETAAALSGLPVADNECWAFLVQGGWALVGSFVPQPIITETSRQMEFSNRAAFEGSTCFQKRCNGLRILTECQRFWEGKDRSIDNDMLSHLAGASPPFESLIDPGDPRFLEPGDMPLKIQAFCKETNQTVPRKPGPVYRCVLESLALYYRRMIQELELLTGSSIERLFVLGDHRHMLLNHFTSNALQRPVMVASADSVGFGSVVVQAMALGHIQALEEARALLRASAKVQTIVPHAHLWDEAYSRFVGLAVEALASS